MTAISTVSDLGITTRPAALVAATGPVAGRRVVDIGCGEGQLIRELGAQGARATGVDPFMEPVGWTETGEGAWRLLRGAADAVPEETGAADLVLFVFSLHHVPGPKLPAALGEARRLLADGGRLYVAEPLAEGLFHHVMVPFHDETRVRAAAAAAIADHAAPHFARRLTFTFIERRRFADFDAFSAAMIANMRFNGYAEADVLAPEVRRRFAAAIAENGGNFDQPVRVDLFGEPRSPV